MLNYRLYNCCNYILLFYKMDIILKLILLIPILIGSFFLWPTFYFWTILPIIGGVGLMDVSGLKTMNFRLI
jgi:hypothetical protein